MNVSIITDHVTYVEGSPPDFLQQALEQARAKGHRVGFPAEGTLDAVRRVAKPQLLVVDSKYAGNWRPGWEELFPNVAVLFSDRVELRQYERLEMGGSKYAIHTERVPCALMEQQQYDWFFTRLARALIDESDARGVIIRAAKNVQPPLSVVQYE